MENPQENVRLLDKTRQPGNEEIRVALGGAAPAWDTLCAYLAAHYDFLPELIFYGRKYGWTVRYRKGGKTLCALFPEHGSFTVLIILGTREAMTAAQAQADFSAPTREMFAGSAQLHDGKWLWLRCGAREDLSDVVALLAYRKKPKIE